MKTNTLWIVAAIVIALVIYAVLPAGKETDSSASHSPAGEAKACQVDHQKQWAYRVKAQVSSSVNDQMLYQSSLVFDLQFEKQGQSIQALAHNASIKEAGQEKSIANLPLRAHAELTPYLSITHVDVLGLPPKHPMLIMTQVAKSLSIGPANTNTRFIYDALGFEYRFIHRNGLQRNLPSSGANAGDSQWQVSLDKDCLIKEMSSVEQKPLMMGSYQGYLRFEIHAHRIEQYVSMANLDFSPDSNAGQQWNTMQVNSAELEKDLTDEAQVWATYKNFSHSRNTARLQKAAKYLIEHVPADELARRMSDGKLGSDVMREMAFSLGIISHPDAEAYLVDTLVSLPKNSGDNIDMQKVRLMVAASGRQADDRWLYDQLMTFSKDAGESDNVKKNALLSASTIANTLNKNSQPGALQELQQNLRDQLRQTDGDSDVASVIMAAGNGDLTSLDADIQRYLVSKEVKNRFAAASVLSKRSVHYDALIQHMAGETSNLVNNAIMQNLDIEALSSSQRGQLADIARQQRKNADDVTAQEKAKLIEQYLR